MTVNLKALTWLPCTLNPVHIWDAVLKTFLCCNVLRPSSVEHIFRHQNHCKNSKALHYILCHRCMATLLNLFVLIKEGKTIFERDGRKATGFFKRKLENTVTVDCYWNTLEDWSVFDIMRNLTFCATDNKAALMLKHFSYVCLSAITNFT